VLSAWRFAAAFRRYDQAAVAERPSPLPLPPSRSPAPLAPGGHERLAEARRALLERGADAALVERLAAFVRQADDFDVGRIRPYALADHWQAARRAVLELCLLATRAGLLNFRWEVLCPLCRGDQRGSASLGEVQSNVHCRSCNIDFNVNFDRSVELAFRPNPAIRATPEATYCVGGPQVTPHIVAQQLLQPGQTRTLSLPLEVGRYRLRTLGLAGGRFLRAEAGGAAEAALRAGPDGWPGDELALSVRPELCLENATPDEQLMILERMAWSDQAATAAEVTSLQVFRDLFANEALRPGERIDVGRLTVLFTDLRDSTRLYRESGDAVAFGQVMSHFDVLRAAIRAENGALVKTIGDSVMAVFTRPVEALRAVLRAQAELAARPGQAALRLKAGVHSGPCVAVNLNDRLDYFGATVNIAARLEKLANTHPGMVASGSVAEDPEVARWLAEGGITAEAFVAELKGYEGERFQLWVIRPGPNPPSPFP
jgi:class 3 adenylate cyclase